VAGRPFRAWLAQVLVSAAQEYRRRRLARAGTLDRPVETVAEPQLVEWDEAEYRRQLLRRGAEVVRADFNPQTWAAFTGVVIEERPAAAVATELRIPESAVYLARNRVLTRLRLELDGLLE
jgi:RNA polymerase sigma-70 factor (ECF subfamily)